MTDLHILEVQNQVFHLKGNCRPTILTEFYSRAGGNHHFFRKILRFAKDKRQKAQSGINCSLHAKFLAG